MVPKPKPRLHAMRRWLFFIAILVLGLDRLTKWLITSSMHLHESVNVIPGLFRITHVQNTGAAFGLFSDHPSEWKVAVLVMFSLAALVVVTILLWRNSHSFTSTGFALSLILGGALGNLWDRLVDGHVVDFLDFHLGGYHWPAFNVADSAIVVGAFILVAEILMARSPGEAPANQ